MGFTKLSLNDINELPELLLPRVPLPNSAAQVYNQVKIYLNIFLPGHASGISYQFYWYAELPPSHTSIVIRYQIQSAPHLVRWMTLGPIESEMKRLPEIMDAFGEIIDWKMTQNCFTGVEERMAEVLLDYMKKHNHELLSSVNPHPVLWMPFDTAQRLAIDELENCEDMSLKEMELSDRDQVMKYWKYVQPYDYLPIGIGIELIGSSGIKLSDGTLISWGLVFPDGAIHNLYTLESHRNKGYGQLVMKNLCRLLVQRGIIPVAQLEPDNSISKRLMLQVGFQFSHLMYWIETKPSNLN